MREDTMPIYEFFCDDCNTVFNFYSGTINTIKIPRCPRCKNRALKRMMSTFATISGRKEEGDAEDFPMDESKMEKALQVMEREMHNIKDEDPRQMASLLRRMTEAAGGNLDEGMEEALRRMEAGEDPENIEAEMGDALNPENIFFSEQKKGGKRPKKIIYDETLYDL